MWSGDKIYFLSDRDAHKRMNLYVQGVGEKHGEAADALHRFRRQVPVAGRQGHRLRERRLDLPLRPGHGKGRRRCRSASWRTDPAPGPSGSSVEQGRIDEFNISPDGKRALFGARGEVFTVPAKTGPTRNLTNTSGVHERDADWSPDGKWIAYVSDADGEDEIYVAPQDGKGRPARSRPKATPINMKSTGRPTARKSSGPTRSCGCSTWTWTRRRCSR